LDIGADSVLYQERETTMQFIIVMILFFIMATIFKAWSIPLWIAIGIFKGINEYILEPRRRRKIQGKDK